ncbi:hypothetical protein RC1_3891 [Rhodospirillum centenum SW]|uniref:Uncharacterized protein n=1 Tax=Rhodospirillum centenum (strain ATCC 51521 / SW) TaxID=414684 RepID=B6IY60_RHOCS|nr:hypothetical protein RC1_3891 [Rhodospirillum centenum SW]
MTSRSHAISPISSVCFFIRSGQSAMDWPARVPIPPSAIPPSG